MFKERTYRKWVESEDLVSFEVKERESDLFVLAARNLERQARESLLNHRSDLERYMTGDPGFYTSLAPVEVNEEAPAIIKAMANAARKAGVGPMAAIAGAVAEFVGRDLAAFTDQVIVENGGDIFLKTSRPRTLGIYAGERSPFTGNLAIEIAPHEDGLGVSTSSGTVSHSLSFGKADAALVISKDAALADAVATACGNAVKGENDIETAIGLARSIEGVSGVLILINEKMGSWGDIKLV